MRKEAGFEITDRIRISFKGDPEVIEAVKRHSDYISGETLADELKVKDGALPEGKAWDLNGRAVTIEVEKVSS